MNNCLNCNSDTKNPKFCCRSCAQSFNNKIYPKRKISRKCSRCYNIVRNYRSLLCEDCFQSYMSSRKNSLLNRTISEYSNRDCIKKLHKSSSNAHIRGFARSWFKDLKSLPCANCGYCKHVELCHIKPISSFDQNDKIKDINCRENIIQLCPNCHWEFDNDLISIDLIKSVQYTRVGTIH